MDNDTIIRQKVLPVYVDWLNSFSDGDNNPYSVDNFDSILNQWAKIEVEASITTDTLRILSFWVSDGDEGGPALLTAQFRTTNSDWTLTALLHEFDSSTELVYILPH